MTRQEKFWAIQLLLSKMATSDNKESVRRLGKNEEEQNLLEEAFSLVDCAIVSIPMINPISLKEGK